MKTLKCIFKPTTALLVSMLFFFPQESFAGEKSIKTEGSQQSVSSKNKTAGNKLTFVTYKYIDPMAGMEAFRLLIPKGWRAEGAVTWSANPALPAQSQFRFFNPNGDEQLEFFPTQSYFWTDNQVFFRTNPPGTLRFGTLVARPVDLHSAFANVIFPAFRRHVRNVQVIERSRVPELERLARGELTPGVNASAEGGKLRLAYLENGKPMEEELYAVVSQFVTFIPGSYLTGRYFINYWYIDYIFSFKAQKGKLDSNSKIFQTMIFSFKINPQWFAKVVNTKEQMVQRISRGIKATGRIGEMIARAGSDMRADQQSDWERRQRVNERIVRNFSDNIRGVQRYNDPYTGKEVELPSEYGYAWANNLGEYITTDSPGYNPNIGSNLHWQQIEPAR